ncbi:hypothetical protein [Mangrovibacterium lignilyticum]|uniref:hypothetical protein n=1 Tax=Mangrovibacterium lignilyticum TaxID=2668052 RepID=UPI0013D0F26D|nr:hypothetical protein [Mangrovibacterium lignilyticum]
MKQLLFLILLFLVGASSYAQSDSIVFETDPAEYEFLYHELFNFSANSIFGAVNSELISPKLNFAESNILDLQINTPQIIDSRLVHPFTNAYWINPFISGYSLNSAAVYRLSDKFKIGGSSFSANSIFNPTPLNFDPNKMNFQGINFYMEYKVSDKFRIGGGIQINHQSSGY